MIEAPACRELRGDSRLTPEVDLVFSLDLTGSMGQETDEIKLQIDEFIAGLREAAPDTNFRFRVVSYEDYAGSFDSSVCPDTYSATYGGSGDEPFRVELALTADDATLSVTVNGLQLGFGGVGPQSYGRVFWEVSQTDTMTELGFRPGFATAGRFRRLHPS